MCGARLSYILLLSPCEVRSEPDPAVSSGWVPVLFVESQTQLPSSAESLRCVDCEPDSVLLMSPEVVHKSRVGSANPLSLWRRLSRPSTESCCVVHICIVGSALSAESYCSTVGAKIIARP